MVGGHMVDDAELPALPPFFDEPAAPAVLKHGILRRYLQIFASKTGIGSPGGRVVYADGYAGPGRYRSGAVGSPLIAMEARRLLAQRQRPRDLDCVFIEKKRAPYEHLRRHVGDDRAFRGEVQGHLDMILQRAFGAPLFLFLDPYGLTLPLDDLIARVLRRNQANPRRPKATELLINFASHTLRREGGHLGTEDRLQSQDTILANIDAFMGGDDWRELWQPNSPEADKAIAARWCRELSRRTSGQFTGWLVPVPRSWDADAYYYLVLVTAHEQGGWFFADTLPNALEDFYSVTNPGQASLFGPEFRREEAVRRFRANVQRLLAVHGAIRLGDYTRELYDGVLGWGGEKELRDAIKGLARGKNAELTFEAPLSDRTYDKVVESTGIAGLF